MTSEKDNQEMKLNMVDQLTKSAAIGLSRRTFMKTLVAGTAALGMRLMGFKTVLASHCRTCFGPCGMCSSTVHCCSPDGSFCVNLTCNCCCGCSCTPFLATATVCNDQSWSSSCPTFLC